MEYMGSSKIGKSKAKKEDEDFDEAEVWQNWALVKDSNFRTKKTENSSSGTKKIPSVSKNGRVSNVCGQYQSSAPMSIPEWSKIKEDSWDSAKSCNDDHGGCLYDDDDEEEEMVPPHEIVARRQARNHIASYSMCEGVGRTLKGRDLSKLRNSILTKTGFLE